MLFFFILFCFFLNFFVLIVSFTLLLLPLKVLIHNSFFLILFVPFKFINFLLSIPILLFVVVLVLITIIFVSVIKLYDQYSKEMFCSSSKEEHFLMWQELKLYSLVVLPHLLQDLHLCFSSMEEDFPHLLKLAVFVFVFVEVEIYYWLVELEFGSEELKLCFSSKEEDFLVVVLLEVLVCHLVSSKDLTFTKNYLQ